MRLPQIPFGKAIPLHQLTLCYCLSSSLGVGTMCLLIPPEYKLRDNRHLFCLIHHGSLHAQDLAYFRTVDSVWWWKHESMKHHLKARETGCLQIRAPSVHCFGNFFFLIILSLLKNIAVNFALHSITWLYLLWYKNNSSNYLPLNKMDTPGREVTLIF